jgi:hypothetical protein
MDIILDFDAEFGMLGEASEHMSVRQLETD